MPDLLTAFALFAIVLTVSALVSGLVERAPLSFPLVFLGLGFLLGERGLGMIVADLHDTTLEAIAILTLSFVLFLDAVKLRLDDIGKEWLVPLLTLGPGSLLIIGFVALAAWLLFQLPPVAALLIGAILASTDPVVLRDVTRDERIPHSVRRALSIESGVNDIIVLPIILVLIAIAQNQTGGSSVQGWLQFLGQVLLLGPVAGFAIGGAGARLMNQMSKRISIRREYEALYGVGLVLASYVVGEAIGGSGFLAAFFAGLAVAVLNVELCSCFLEYGEVTAEMAMLVAFVLFGAVLSTSLTSLALAPALLLAIIVVIIARPLLINFVLLKANISRTARAFIGWFGPRGLSSLLFALLVVHAGVENAEQLFAITGVVVLVSVIIHGVSATPLSAWYGRKMASETLPEEREATVAGLFQPPANETLRITAEELAERLAGTNPPIVLDVRSRYEYAAEPTKISGSVRVLPDEITNWTADQPRTRPVVAYCT